MPTTPRTGLQNRVMVTIGLIALIAALLVSIPTYAFSRAYLLEQRENAALSRTLVNARVLQVALDDGLEPGEALANVPSVGDSQPMLRYQNTWYTRGVSVKPEELPVTLLEAAAPEGAYQRFEVSAGDVFLGIALPVSSGVYLEAFPLADLSGTIGLIGLLLVVSSVVAMAAGLALGRWAGHVILRPLRAISDAAHRITAGDLTARLDPPDDPDLGPIAQAFNDMTSTVEERLAREQRFSANVSHELRSPLTGIQGTAALLEDRLDNIPPKEARLVSALASQVRRFTILVLDLLELSRIGGDQSVVVERIDVREAARTVLAEHDLDVDLLLEGPPAQVSTDLRRLDRILANLIENAIAHGEGVRRIRVTSRHDGVSVDIEDQGPGVPEELRGRIFEPFNRGNKTDRAGSGLGLAIVAEQARLIGATISVEDADGGGARFRLVLHNTPVWS